MAEQDPILEGTRVLANSTFFAIFGLVFGGVWLCKSYLENIFEISRLFPRLVAFVYCFGGFTFAYLMITWAVLLNPQTAEEHVWRSCFAFCGIIMNFGPFLIFTPRKPIDVKQKWLRKAVEVTQKKETRYGALAFFLLLSCLQGFVGYAIWGVLSSLDSDANQIVGFLVGYLLIVIYYLIAFYEAMAKKSVIIRGVNLLEEIRSNMFISWRQISVQVLHHKYFAHIYLILFIVAVLGSLAVTGVILYLEINSFGDEVFTAVLKAFVIIMGVGNFGTVVCLAIYVGNVALNPVKVPRKLLLEGGKEIFISSIKAFAWAESKTRVLINTYYNEISQKMEKDLKGRIDRDVQEILKKTSADANYSHLWEMGDLNVCQKNDEVHMLFLTTDSKCPAETSYYFLSLVEEEGPQIRSTYKFFGFLDDLFRKFDANRTTKEEDLKDNEKDKNLKDKSDRGSHSKENSQSLLLHPPADDAHKGETPTRALRDDRSQPKDVPSPELKEKLTPKSGRRVFESVQERSEELQEIRSHIKQEEASKESDDQENLLSIKQKMIQQEQMLRFIEVSVTIDISDPILDFIDVSEIFRGLLRPGEDKLSSEFMKKMFDKSKLPQAIIQQILKLVGTPERWDYFHFAQAVKLLRVAFKMYLSYSKDEIVEFLQSLKSIQQ